MSTHISRAGTSVKQNMSKIPHPKHELARKPIVHEVPKAMTHDVHETETSVLQLLVGESTKENDRDKPAVAPLFTVETKYVWSFKYRQQ